MKSIPPFKLVPNPITDAAESLPKFKWADNLIGTRHKLGGKPDFIQRANWPNCPDCNEKMTFYAQLDSVNDEFCIADCGMIYIFICFECNNIESFTQSY